MVLANQGLSTGVAIVLGLANVLADGFSMAVGNYLKNLERALMVITTLKAELSLASKQRWMLFP